MSEVKIQILINTLMQLRNNGVDTINAETTVGEILSKRFTVSEDPQLGVTILDLRNDLHTLFTGRSNGESYRPENMSRKVLVRLNDKQLVSSSFFLGLFEDALRQYKHDLFVEIEGGNDAINIGLEYQRARTRYFINSLS